jgi:hypothetical protein
MPPYTQTDIPLTTTFSDSRGTKMDITQKTDIRKFSRKRLFLHNYRIGKESKIKL